MIKSEIINKIKGRLEDKRCSRFVQEDNFVPNRISINSKLLLGKISNWETAKQRSNIKSIFFLTKTLKL